MWNRGAGAIQASVVSRIKDQHSDDDPRFPQEVADQVGLAAENMKANEDTAALNRTVALGVKA